MRLFCRLHSILRKPIAFNKHHLARLVSYNRIVSSSPTTQRCHSLIQPSPLTPRSINSLRLSHSSTSSPSSRAPLSSPTMDDSEIKTENTNNTQPESQSTSHPAPLPALPALPAATDGSSSTLEVGGAALRLDHLGPLVVNEDGTLSRIANWEKMADIERENTLRISKHYSPLIVL